MQRTGQGTETPDDPGAPASDEVSRIRLTEEEARQGEIILRRPWQRWVFLLPIVALVAGGIVLTLVLTLP